MYKSNDKHKSIQRNNMHLNQKINTSVLHATIESDPCNPGDRLSVNALIDRKRVAGQSK